MQLFGKKKKEDQSHIDAAAEKIFGGQEFSRYYYGVAGVYRIVEFLFLAIFFIYVIITAAGNTESIKYENLEYIIRNFAFELDEKDFNSTAIRYNPDGDLNFTLFGKGLAVCGRTGINIFSANGRKTCSDLYSYSSPISAGSDKYVIVCDNGGSEYSVYNMFSKVHTEKVNYPIRGVCMSDDGHYAVITRTDDYMSAVFLYDSDFRPVNRYMKNGYIMSADINNNNILITTLNVDENGEYVTEVMLCRIGDDKSAATMTIKRSFPLKCSLVNDGICVLCDDAVYYYNEGGFPIGTFEYGLYELYGFDFSDEATLILFGRDRLNKEYDAVLLDNTGKKIASHTVKGPVKSYEIFSQNAYILTSEGIILIDADGIGISEYKDHGADGEILAYAENRLYVCRTNIADVVKTEK